MNDLGPDANLAKELEELAQICQAEGAVLTAAALTRAVDRIEKLEFTLHSLHLYAKTAVENGPVHPTLAPMLEATVQVLRGHS